jgi:hypothetical protein
MMRLCRVYPLSSEGRPLPRQCGLRWSMSRTSRSLSPQHVQTAPYASRICRRRVENRSRNHSLQSPQSEPVGADCLRHVRHMPSATRFRRCFPIARRGASMQVLQRYASEGVSQVAHSPEARRVSRRRLLADRSPLQSRQMRLAFPSIAGCLRHRMQVPSRSRRSRHAGHTGDLDGQGSVVEHSTQARPVNFPTTRRR